MSEERTEQSTTEQSQQNVVDKVTSSPEFQESYEAVFGDAADSGSEAPSTSTESSPNRDRLNRIKQQQSKARSDRAKEAEKKESLMSITGPTADQDEGIDDDDIPYDPNAEPDTEDDESQSDDETQVEPKAFQDATNAIDYKLIQAAKRNGWNDEDIVAFVEADPDLAEKTFTRLWGSYNDLSVQYSRIGRNQTLNNTNRPPQQQQYPPAAKQAAAQDMLSRVFDAEKINIIKETYGDEFLSTVINPMVNSMVGPLAEMYGHYQQQKASAIHRETTSYLTSLPDNYKDIYGNGNKLTPQQQQARTALYDEADFIRAGAAAHDIDLTVSEALERANAIVSSKYIEEMAARRVLDSVKKRKKNISPRPGRSGSNRTPSTYQHTSEKSRENAIAAAAEIGEQIGLF